MKSLILSTLILSSILWSSCDKIDDPFPEDRSNNNTDTTIAAGEFETPDLSNLKRRILLEDYTGQTCGNCPGAALTAKGLKTTYEDQIIVVAVHAGFFAEPYPSGSKFRTDFRTASGDVWNDDFAVTGNPKGMISRTEYNSTTVLDPNAWGSAIAVMEEDIPLFDVQLKVDFNSTDNTIDITSGAYVVNDISGDYNLILCLVEDSIVDWQKNYSGGGDPNYPDGDVSDYVHEHVLRDNINGSYGDAIISGSESGDSWLINTYSYNIDNTWNVDHCSIIGFIIDANTNVVYQANEIYITDNH